MTCGNIEGVEAVGMYVDAYHDLNTLHTIAIALGGTSMSNHRVHTGSVSDMFDVADNLTT